MKILSSEEIIKIFNPLVFQEESGRLKINAILFHIGGDLQIFLIGGDIHLGAIALAENNQEIRFCSATNHKDFLPARKMAERVSQALGLRVGVICGIHFDKISQEEIEECLILCQRLTDDIIYTLSNNKT